MKATRNGWVQTVRGAVIVNGTVLNAGDGAAMSGENSRDVEIRDDSEILVFDLA